MCFHHRVWCTHGNVYQQTASGTCLLVVQGKFLTHSHFQKIFPGKNCDTSSFQENDNKKFHLSVSIMGCSIFIFFPVSLLLLLLFFAFFANLLIQHLHCKWTNYENWIWNKDDDDFFPDTINVFNKIWHFTLHIIWNLGYNLKAHELITCLNKSFLTDLMWWKMKN